MFSLNEFSINLIYFLIQYFAYISVILLINKAKIEFNKGVIFLIVISSISAIIKTLMPTTSLEFIGILVMFLIFIENTLIFSTDVFSSLVLTSICSLMSFFTNIICVSFNIFASFDSYMLCYSLALLVIAAFSSEYLYIHDVDGMICKFKASANNISDTYFILLILILSYNFSATQNIDLVYFFIFSQTLASIYILNSIVSKIAFENARLSVKTMHLEHKELKKIIDGIRVFKHDYSNTLCSIGGYISLNDMKGLKKYYDKLTVELKNTNNLQMINTSTINEPSIYNLLASKHNIILQNNLKFDFYSSINYKDLKICSYDFSKLLGIFLDNAIDAANLSKEREISLTCKKNRNKDYQITIKNSYINKDVDIEKIYLKGYSSKNVKSGLGLWEVSKILKSNPNISLNTYKDENYFTQTLVISA